MILDRFALQALADQLGGRLMWPKEGPEDVRFTHLSTDSRRLHDAGQGLEHTLFVALRGDRHDGHQHLAEARAMGVRGFVAALDWSGALPGAVVLRVPHPLLALQSLGAMARFARTGQVVGITGSNGKTIVKEWAHALISPHRLTSRSPGSWNSQIGVPLSLWALDDRADVHLVEAGISQPGEMAALARILRPDIGVMVHFGDAHDAHFPDRATKAREKLRLFEGADRIVVGTRDPDLIAAIQERDWLDRCTFWSLDGPMDTDSAITPDLRVQSNMAGRQCTLSGHWKDTPIDWTVPFTDRTSISNALTTALLALELGLTPKEVGEGLKRLRPLGMRLEHLEGQGGGTIINDTWNHDLDGLSTALDALERLPDGRKRAVILSDLVPFDAQDPAQLERLRRAIGQRRVDRWISVGPGLATGIPGVDRTHAHHPDTDALLNSADLADLEGWNVLVKGARAFEFERVSNALEVNPHATVLDLNLGRLAHNLQRFRDRFNKPIMGMVKALAYGAGDAVAVELDQLGIDRLAVAFAEEGIALRKRGVRCPILVLNADHQRFGDLIQWRLEPEIHRLTDLDHWADALRRSGPIGQQAGRAGVHLKVETGMHRLGFEATEWTAAGRRCADLGLPVISVYSHLSAADEPEADDHTRRQIQRFDEACGAIESALSEAKGDAPEAPFLRHLVNTAGAHRFPEAHHDLIRIGLGLYGLDASNSVDDLQPIGSFHTSVSHVHTVPAGEAVGYGARDRAEHDRLIATLPVGYADGLPRAAGMGRATLFVEGESRPIVGPVCMDSCMLDVTGLAVQRGTRVEIFGDHAPLAQLAAATDTIPYELLCRIPQRVRRRQRRT